MPSLPVYATPKDFWQYAAPPNTLFQDSIFERSSWTDVTKTGSGTGTMDLDLASNPRDTFPVVVRCTQTGELQLDGILNAGPYPKFIISLDGGISFSRPLQTNSAGKLAYQLGGFTLIFSSGTVAPSFVNGDEFRFSTTVSEDMLAGLALASRQMDPYIANTYTLPLLSWTADVTMVCCELHRWNMILRAGLDKGQDFEVYAPKRAKEWLEKVSNGDIQIDVTETGPGILYPQFQTRRGPYWSSWRF